MARWRKITIAIVVATVLILAGYDVWVINTKGVDTSISRVFIDLAHRYPIIVLSFGILVGHLVWPQPVPAMLRWVVRKVKFR
jgi:hypothetical protein